MRHKIRLQWQPASNVKRNTRNSRSQLNPQPQGVDRSTFHAELEALRVREKACTKEGDAIAGARRRLPMVEVDGVTPLIGPHGTVTLL